MSDPGFRAELIAEARLASMIHHANVVDVRDVEIDGESISLVMDYIEGASLGDLIVAAANARTVVPARVAVRIVVDALAGLHAAHELLDERGRSIGLVHRDMSPQNILVGLDGISRVADFGVAKFSHKNAQSTSEGNLKGKLAYMAPEYLRGEVIDRRFDVFGAGVVLWEALCGERCFRRANEAETLHALLNHEPKPISEMVEGLGPALDDVIARALSKSRKDRFESAAGMAATLERTASAAQLIAGPVEVADAVRALTGSSIEERRSSVRAKLASEPSVSSLLQVPAEHVPPVDLPVEATIDQTRHMTPLPRRGPVRTLPLSNSVTPVPRAAPEVTPSGAAEYVSDLSAIGLPSRRRSKWPFGLIAFLAVGAIVGIAVVTMRPTERVAAASAPSATVTASESPSASGIASASSIVNNNPVSTTAPPTLPASPPPRSPAGRAPARATSTSRRPPPNPYQDP